VAFLQLALDRRANFPAWLHILRGGTGDLSAAGSNDYESDSDDEGGGLGGGNRQTNDAGVSSKQLAKISKKLSLLEEMVKLRLAETE
jgi:hypothetical protein